LINFPQKLAKFISFTLEKLELNPFFKIKKKKFAEKKKHWLWDSHLQQKTIQPKNTSTKSRMQRDRDTERERENTHKIQANEYYAVCQTDTGIVWESFMSKSKQLCMWVVWRWWLQAILTEKSPSFTCTPHNWVLYIHTSCMREPPALKQASCLELRVAGQLKSNKAPNLLYECKYVCTT
jgi:hypothetical protein